MPDPPAIARAGQHIRTAQKARRYDAFDAKLAHVNEKGTPTPKPVWPTSRGAVPRYGRGETCRARGQPRAT